MCWLYDTDFHTFNKLYVILSWYVRHRLYYIPVVFLLLFYQQVVWFDGINLGIQAPYIMWARRRNDPDLSRDKST